MGNIVWAWLCRIYPLPSCTNHYCLNVGTLLGTRQNVFEHLRVFGGGKSCTLCNCHNTHLANFDDSYNMLGMVNGSAKYVLENGFEL